MTHRARPSTVLLIFLLMAATVAATVPALADHPASATPAELRELRTEVNRLDDTLKMVKDDHSRAREFRNREKEIREDLAWLRDQMLQHQRDESKGLGATSAEVEALRREIRRLRNDIDDALDGPVAGRGGDVDVPDGTQIQLRLEEPLSSRTSRPEDRVVATVAEPVYGDDGSRPAIPAGTEVRGVVEDVQPAQRPSKGGRVDMAFDSLVLDNQPVSIDARVVQVKEGGIDERKAGLGALIGGVLGAVIDDKKGALVGAILGGGGAVVASSGQEVELPAGTLLTLRLERPLRVAQR
ncbi:MAG TPA: hypothetical protein VLL75_04990 [Vicinamibacteria bacterium]|nr:hypothetical protein [Vicinamibacteria bacterium]